ncbi:MAG: hypothetical protein JXR94_03925 [Candidatus Hydrogenedentes bacterium]|nr:hypothetical protein [Candidatus Hydrogenedentota bacterium]
MRKLLFPMVAALAGAALLGASAAFAEAGKSRVTHTELDDVAVPPPRAGAAEPAPAPPPAPAPRATSEGGEAADTAGAAGPELKRGEAPEPKPEREPVIVVPSRSGSSGTRVAAFWMMLPESE